MKNKMYYFKAITTLLIFSISISSFTSCSFEDEIQLDPGQLIIHNPSVSSYDITIKSMDENSQEVNHEFWLNSEESITFDLEKGYEYEVAALENNPNKTILKVIVETIVIGPHQPTEFHLPEE